jgi:hypothetical protein
MTGPDDPFFSLDRARCLATMTSVTPPEDP